MKAIENLPTGKSHALPVVVHHMRDLGQLIQQMRKRQRLTQRDIAGLAGAGVRFMVDLEHGKPTVQMQKALDVLALLGLEVVIRKKGSSNTGEL